MKAIICTCNDEIKIDPKNVRLFLNSNKKINDVKIYKNLCNIDEEELISEIKGSKEKTIVGACTERRNPFFSNDLDKVKVLDLKTYCSSVHSGENKINEKVKRLLNENIDELSKRKRFYLKGDQRNILSMEPSFGDENNKHLLHKRKYCPSTEDWSCSYCKESCPKDLFYGKKLVVDEKECDVCGICSNSCPLDLIETKPSKNLNSSIKKILEKTKKNKGTISNLLGKTNDLDNEIVVFSCENKPEETFRFIAKKELNYPPEILPISVSCVSEVSLMNLINVFFEGGQGAILLGCEKCYNKSSSYIKDIIERFNSFFEKTNLENRVKYLKTDGRNYKEINKELNEFKSKMDQRKEINLESPKKEIRNESLEHYDTKKRKKDLITIESALSQLNIEKNKLNNLIPIYVPKINKDKCNGCGDCAEVCSTEAIQHKDDIMVLQEWKCIGCEKCIEECSKDAIKLRDNEEIPSIKNKYGVSK